MFKFINDTVAICLEGTAFRRRNKKTPNQPISEQVCSYSPESQSPSPPYVLTQEEYKIKNDLISKLHSTDNRLQETRQRDRRGRAKWIPLHNEQVYNPPTPTASSPQLEVYYKILGTHIVQDPRTTWTSLSGTR
jgi:hypothetical protein